MKKHSKKSRKNKTKLKSKIRKIIKISAPNPIPVSNLISEPKSDYGVILDKLGYNSQDFLFIRKSMDNLKFRQKSTSIILNLRF